MRVVSVPRCVVCGGPDAEGNGCEFCPAVGAPSIAELREMSDNALRTLIAVERENGRAHGEIAEAARLLLALRTGEPAQ
jgi:hypothetical protein